MPLGVLGVSEEMSRQTLAIVITTIVCLILGGIVLWAGPRSSDVTPAEPDPQPTADGSTMDAAEGLRQDVPASSETGPPVAPLPTNAAFRKWETVATNAVNAYLKKGVTVEEWHEGISTYLIPEAQHGYSGVGPDDITASGSVKSLTMLSRASDDTVVWADVETTDGDVIAVSLYNAGGGEWKVLQFAVRGDGEQ